MAENEITRRTLLAGAAALALAAAAALPGCGQGSGGGGGGGGRGGTGVAIFKLSPGGRRVSRAAKSHDANMLFRTFLAADTNRAHPGDTSNVVQIMVSRARFEQLFGHGRDVADLRHLEAGQIV